MAVINLTGVRSRANHASPLSPADRRALSSDSDPDMDEALRRARQNAALSLAGVDELHRVEENIAWDARTQGRAEYRAWAYGVAA